MAAAKNKFLTKRYIGFFLAIVVFLLIKFVLPLDSLGSVTLSEPSPLATVRTIAASSVS